MLEWLWYNVEPAFVAGMDPNDMLNALLCVLGGTVVGRFIERYSVPPGEAPPDMAERLELLSARLQAAQAVTLGTSRELSDGSKLPMPSPEQVMAVCKHRRSIFPKDCDFSKKGLCSRSVLEQMCEAANWAPTHGITEPWRFVIMQDDAIDTLNALKLQHAKSTLSGEKLEAQLSKLEAKSRQLSNCSALIAVCCKRVPNKSGKPMPEWEEIASCSIAVQNMHLVLCSQGGGLGGYWSSGGCGDFTEGWGNCAEAKKLFVSTNAFLPPHRDYTDVSDRVCLR